MKNEVTRNPAAAVELSTPYVAPGVTDPQALRYRQEFDRRRQAGKSLAAGPSIPLLAGEAQEGRTMAEQARRPTAAPQGSIIEPPMTRPPSGLLPQDMLPDEATRDPSYIEGAGSRYATSQPALAYKYGVIRQGQRLAPQQLGGRSSGLSQATVDGLQAVQSFNKTREKAESTDGQIEADAAAGPAGAGARIGKPVDEKAKAEDVEKVLSQLDDFDFNKFREAVTKDLLNNDDQRKIIEARLSPLSLDDVIVNGFVTQFVPIIPGKFEPEFQSLMAGDDLALKRMIMEESRTIEVNARYFLDKFTLMGVAAGLRSINRNPLPDCHDANGDFNADLFQLKFERVARFNLHMLQSLGVNYYWFDIRVRKLFVAEKLGNG